mmetsp:Transcript_9861/g.60042  ORF Transcript_9861/g.60042 Transcript_9861/m.60042 type:complete len:315 (+) Transcript_9861:1933-2877(+)
MQNVYGVEGWSVPQPDDTWYIQSSDDVTLAVHVHERKEGRTTHPKDTILLFHCNGFHAMAYHQLMRDFTDKFRCLGVDLRGHGSSTAPKRRSWSWHAFAEDVSNVVETLQLHGCYAFGHSLGAAACLIACIKLKKLFSGMYLFEPPVFPPAEREKLAKSNELAEAARRRKVVYNSMSEAWQSFQSKAAFRRIDPDALKAYVAHGLVPCEVDGLQRYTLKCNPEHEAIIYEEGGKVDVFNLLGRITQPVVLATGDPKVRGPGQYGRQIVHQLSRGRLSVFKEMSHFGPLEKHSVLSQEVIGAFTSDWMAGRWSKL